MVFFSHLKNFFLIIQVNTFIENTVQWTVAILMAQQLSSFPGTLYTPYHTNHLAVVGAAVFSLKNNSVTAWLVWGSHSCEPDNSSVLSFSHCV